MLPCWAQVGFALTTWPGGAIPAELFGPVPPGPVPAAAEEAGTGELEGAALDPREGMPAGAVLTPEGAAGLGADAEAEGRVGMPDGGPAERPGIACGAGSFFS